MSHYAKLATVGVRVVATFIILFGSMGIVYTIGAALLGFHPRVELSRYFFSSVVYFLAGIFIFLLGKVVGRIAARNIE